jgi:hypothetical protein
MMPSAALAITAPATPAASAPVGVGTVSVSVCAPRVSSLVSFAEAKSAPAARADDHFATDGIADVPSRTIAFGAALGWSARSV